MTRDAQYWIKKLELSKHPEGGYYKEVYRSVETLEKQCLPDRFKNKRCFATSIYFLIESGDYSRFHRIKSDELWHFYEGCSLEIHTLERDGHLSTIKLGKDIQNGESFLAVIPSGVWTAACPVEETSYTLFACTAAPGFEFDDFDLAERDALVAEFPDQKDLIHKMT